MPEPASDPILVLVRDLLLASRITATAKPLGVSYKLLRDPAALDGNMDAPLLLADLNLPGAIEAAAGWGKAKEGRRAIGFVSHVDAETIARARQAGIVEVYARSKFFESLESLLSKPDR
jgi:hypothetical protein